MTVKQRISVFSQLGRILNEFRIEQDWKGFETGLSQEEFENFNKLIKSVKQFNGWFIEENVRHAIGAISDMLNEADLVAWANKYELSNELSDKTTAIIMAGNIPLVGFHDFLSVMMAGHKLQVKLSSSDDKLLPAILSFLFNLAPELKQRISLTPRLSNFDGVIATGSNNSAMYFESYFSKYPNIIRKNRTSVAVLSGKETEEELSNLAEDVFRYFGLGCRNVTKVFVPRGYDLDLLFGAFYSWKDITKNNKYANNYDYNKAIYLMNQTELIENGFLLLKEDEGLHSPLGVLFYEYYDNETELNKKLKNKKDELQCVVSSTNIPFGEAQKPKLWDYADGVDTIDFLQSI